MRIVRLVLAAAVAAAVLVAGAGQRASARSPAPPPAGRVSGDVLALAAQGKDVRVNIALAAALPERPSRAAVLRAVADAQASVLARLPRDGISLIYRHAGLPGLTALVAPGVVRALEYDPDVAAVTLDATGAGAALAPPAAGEAAPAELSHSVPLIEADRVHDLGITGAGVTVAILDSGADTDHPDLADSIAVQECFLSGSGSHCPDGTVRQSGAGSAEDDLGHGTNVTGIVTSNGVVSPTGVAPGASVALYKVLNSSNFGQISDWDAALSDIIANHPEVRAINMSLVSFVTFSGDCSSFDPNTASAFSILRGLGVSIFVSSGNNGVKTGITYPACVPGAISVGAVYDQDFASSTFFGCTDTPATTDAPTCWSNSRPDLDLLAPGSFILSDGLGGGTSVYIGTSQAAPHAAGVAALMLENGPGLTPDGVEATLQQSGVPRTDAANGVVTPRIDALRAVTQLRAVGGVAALPDLPPRAGSSGSTAALLSACAIGASLLAGGYVRRRRGRARRPAR